MQQTEHKTFAAPEEIRQFPNGRAEILRVGGSEVGRLVFEPGWRSVVVRESAWTTARSSWAAPGDVTSLPGGHDAWVIGDEPVVVVDWFCASNYAKHG
jgi:hypothetical protein